MYQVSESHWQLERIRTLLELCAYATIKGANVTDLVFRLVTFTERRSEDRILEEIKSRLFATLGEAN